MSNTKVISILVKAYAKLYGNIEPTTGGRAEDVLSKFLGSETDWKASFHGGDPVKWKES